MSSLRLPASLARAGFLLLLFACVSCEANSSRSLPRQLAGVWTTTDPRYHGRFFELSPAFVIVVTGPEEPPSVQLIHKVKAERTAGETIYTVYSTDQSQKTEHQMVFTFNAANGGEIRFRNQNDIWRRGTDQAE